MEEDAKKRKNSFILKCILYIVAVFIIIQLFPRENRFKFYYQNAKPWQYELLTAPFDFPIYKEDAQLKKEQDSVLQTMPSYYKLETNELASQTEKLNKLFSAHTDTSSLQYKNYILQQLNNIYAIGIISSDNLDNLTQHAKKTISVVKSHVSDTQNLDNVFTVKSAYNYILDNIPHNLDIHTLKSYDVNKYLTENLLSDEQMSEQIKAETIKNISTTTGIVQTGERIIDKGEILNNHSFQILNSLKKETESRIATGSKYTMLLAGQVLLIFSLMLLLFLFLLLFRPLIFANINNVLFILMMILIMVSLARFTLRWTHLSIYIVPFALLPIIVRTFFDSRTALFVHIITILLISFMVASPFEFVLLQLTVGMTAVYSLKDLTQRSQLIQASGLIVITYFLIYLSYSLIIDGDVNAINWSVFVYFIINGLLLLFAYGLIYIFEKIFGFLSNVTLVELSNVNNDLLMKFSEEAPGTFQHSLQVSSLATEAAARINANSLLVRTGALYHDIGKMANSMYFIENQSSKANPLSLLEYDEAAKIVIDHVSDGVKIAQKHNIPSAVIDFIETHHAQGKAKYFYNSFKNKYPDLEIDESVFTYPGPKPFSKEMAILMMADAIEATSRSLTEYTEDSIDKLVERIVDTQIAEGSFKNAPITFQQIEIVKKVFKQKLKNIYHSRINYPALIRD
jgi:putative nucleotidyltransferase with HDIG domain